MRILFIFLIISQQICLAQYNNVLITGTVLNDSFGEVIIEINKRYINNTVEEYSATLNEQHNFGLTCRIEIPQLVTLKYGNKQCQLFLEPNDSLYIEFDSQSFPNKLGFSERGKDNNILWQNYQKNFPEDPIVFKYRQYRKGNYYYNIHEDLDKIMQTNSPDDFKLLLEAQLLEKQSLYKLFANAENSRLTSDFSIFIQTEFIYDYWLKLLTYGDVYHGRHRLDSSFLSFLDTALVQDDLSLGNEKYRNFILAMIHHRCRHIPSEEPTIYNQLYYYSKEYLEGRTKYFIMANVLATALHKEEPKSVLPIYEDFIEDNPYYELDKIVLDPFQKSNQFSAGTPAPNFTLYDIEGNKVSLAQYKGKVVYLDFWASWCRPCIQKIEALQEFEPQFEGKEVVFLHVSLDRSKNQWLSTVEEKKMVGKHLFFDPSSSTITADYNILSVPKFFLITKDGNFAYTPTSYDSKDLELALKKLLLN